MNNSLMKSKGFVISTDAFLGLALLFLVVLVSYSYLEQVSFSAWESVDLTSFARDELTLLEKSGIIKSAVLGSSAEVITDYVSYTPDAYCVEVNVFSTSDLVTPIITATKTGCTKSFYNVSYADRSIVVNSTSSVDFYLARIGVWFKESES